MPISKPRILVLILSSVAAVIARTHINSLPAFVIIGPASAAQPWLGDPAALLSLVLTLAFLRGAARLPTFLSLAIIAVTFVVLVYVLVLGRKAKGSGEGAA